MSARKYMDWMNIPVQVTVYSFTCDAVGCHGSCEVAVSDDTDEVIRVNDEEPTFNMPVIDMDGAREYLLVECGWEEGTQGVQRGHLYCPKHAEQVA